ncbi:hypothetical protein M5099_02060 [Neisseria meningitidis]|nr:hypothetical protein [Neisseria meningitidis]
MIWCRDRTVEESVQKSRLKNVQTAFLISGRYYSGLTKIRTRRRSRRQYK